VPLSLKVFSSTFNQKIKFSAIFFKNMETNDWVEDNCSIIVLIIGTKSKVAGTVKINLANMLKNDNNFDNFSIKLDKCPDKNARITFNMILDKDRELDSNGFYNEIRLNPDTVILDEEYYPQKIEEKIEFSQQKIDISYQKNSQIEGIPNEKEISFENRDDSKNYSEFIIVKSDSDISQITKFAD